MNLVNRSRQTVGSDLYRETDQFRQMSLPLLTICPPARDISTQRPCKIRAGLRVSAPDTRSRRNPARCVQDQRQNCTGTTPAATTPGDNGSVRQLADRASRVDSRQHRRHSRHCMIEECSDSECSCVRGHRGRCPDRHRRYLCHGALSLPPGHRSPCCDAESRSGGGSRANFGPPGKSVRSNLVVITA